MLAIVLKLVGLLLKQGQTACNSNNSSSSSGNSDSGSSSSDSGGGGGGHGHHHNHHHYNTASLAKTLKSMPFQNCAGVP